MPFGQQDMLPNKVLEQALADKLKVAGCSLQALPASYHMRVEYVEYARREMC